MQPIPLEAELERHHRAAFGWALTCCRWDRTGAEDVVQACYLKILDGRARFGGRAGFKTWLFAVIRRTAAEHRRREAVGRLVPLVGLDHRPEGRDPAPDAATTLALSESNTELIRALRSLPGRQRDLLHLVFYQDLTIAEGATVLGISIGTARTHYERGKARLRTLLGRDSSPGDRVREGGGG